MGGFVEDSVDLDNQIISTEGKIKELSRKLEISRLELSKLLHKKQRIKYNYRAFYKKSDKGYTFKCILCGNRANADTRLARYCPDCKLKARQEKYKILGWNPNAREPKDSI